MRLAKDATTYTARMSKEALVFIQMEQERTLQNVENGTISKEQAIGSLNTLFQIASYIEDKESMVQLSQLMAHLRSVSHSFQLRPAYYRNTNVSAQYIG